MKRIVYMIAGLAMALTAAIFTGNVAQAAPAMAVQSEAASKSDIQTVGYGYRRRGYGYGRGYGRRYGWRGRGYGRGYGWRGRRYGGRGYYRRGYGGYGRY